MHTAPGPLSHRTCIQTFRAKFIAPACRFCVNVVALTEMHVSRILIENVVEYARFAVSLKLQSEVNSSYPDVWTFCSELIESVRQVGVTTFGAVRSSGPPSPENCAVVRS